MPTRTNKPGAGRPTLHGAKKVRVQIYLDPDLADHLEAEDISGPDRAKVARRRKQEAAALLATAEIQSRII